MNPLPLTEAYVRAQATEKVYDRGLAYFRGGHVGALVRRGHELAAEVEGSDLDPYAVRLTLSGDEAEARCTCPYEWGGWCKHAVAVALAALDDPTTVEERPPLRESLRTLAPDALVELLADLAERHPALLCEIEGRIDPGWACPERDEWDEWDEAW